MSPKLDQSIIRSLKIDPSTARISSHGGSGFASTHQITTPSTSIFVKTSSSPGAKVMFEGEHFSLNAIHDVVPSLCPRSLAWGKLEDEKGGWFLATEFLDLGGRERGKGKGSGNGMSLARKLAKLHSTPAPVPEGFGTPQFGFPVTTCCGDTPQRNGYKEGWAEFFAENRLSAILERSEERNGKDGELRRIVERAVERVVPRLLGEGHLGGKGGVKPVVVHGDLWSGNKGRGMFVGRNGDDVVDEEDVCFDPSASYAHSEYDHGIMKMFGGFGPGFWKEYFEILPRTEPVEEYEDRVRLYESYHHLNHYAMFGGSYKSGAVGLLKPLIEKYGG